MKFSLILFFLKFIFTSYVIAAERKPIGVATSNSTYLYPRVPTGLQYDPTVFSSQAITETASKSFNFDWEDVRKGIQDARNKLCEVVGNGQIKFWLHASADGKIGYIMEGKAEAGIEVVVLCKK